MKKLTALFCILVTVFTVAGQTISPAPYCTPQSGYVDPTVIKFTVANTGTGWLISWAGVPFAVQWAAFGREYIGKADTIGKCCSLANGGILASAYDSAGLKWYTVWDLPINFSSGAALTSLFIPYNTRTVCGTLETDGITHSYYLELSNYPAGKAKVLITWATPNQPVTHCAFSDIGVSPSPPPASNTKPPKPPKGNGKP